MCEKTNLSETPPRELRNSNRCSLHLRRQNARPHDPQDTAHPQGVLCGAQREMPKGRAAQREIPDRAGRAPVANAKGQGARLREIPTGQGGAPVGNAKECQKKGC